VLLGPEDTGMPFDVLLETDLVAPVWNHQLGPVEGRLVAPLGSVLLDPANDDLGELDPARRGVPFRRFHDSRGAWKRQELATLQDLARPCVQELLGAGPVGAPEPWATVRLRVAERELALAAEVGTSLVDGAVEPLRLIVDLEGRAGVA